MIPRSPKYRSHNILMRIIDHLRAFIPLQHLTLPLVVGSKIKANPRRAFGGVPINPHRTPVVLTTDHNRNQFIIPLQVLQPCQCLTMYLRSIGLIHKDLLGNKSHTPMEAHREGRLLLVQRANHPHNFQAPLRQLLLTRPALLLHLPGEMIMNDPRLRLANHPLLGISLPTFILHGPQIQHTGQCMNRVIHPLFHPRQYIHSIITTLPTSRICSSHILHQKNQSLDIRSFSNSLSNPYRERCIITFCFDFRRSTSREWVVYLRRQI